MNFRAFLRGYRALHFGGHSADAPVGNGVQPEIQVIDLVHLNHLRKFRNSTKEKFCCINSLNYADEPDRNAVLDWLSERILG